MNEIWIKKERKRKKIEKKKENKKIRQSFQSPSTEGYFLHELHHNMHLEGVKFKWCNISIFVTTKYQRFYFIPSDCLTGINKCNNLEIYMQYTII